MNIHLDTHQRYEDGQFRTTCTCGSEFVGADPDSADAAQLEHRDAERAKYRPIGWDDMGSSARDLWEDHMVTAEERCRDRATSNAPH